MDNIRNLTPEEKNHYEEKGYVILQNLFTKGECDEIKETMLAVLDGRKQVKGFTPRSKDDPGAFWFRVFNLHIQEPYFLNWLTHPRLKKPLEDICGGAVDGIQMMYFFKGSEQARHQDQYYLPECFAAWIALMPVNPDNGTIYIQEGSHRGHVITGEERGFKNTQDPVSWEGYNEEVDALFEKNGLPEYPIIADVGDVVIFHGRLIHRGGPIQKPGSFRHALVNHYIPHDFHPWPFPQMPRYDFTGIRREADAVV
ncbi:phytanoyl-CoA dioxygenase family protein [Oscillatoria amoena NRMC-F 0135]|nr:phytanoyl-CoA dioxygenase family protein [Oscillatoria laete-virens]MDL5051041.1 phytanoyl-CoA dioxygenase family protein [Oscillatoria amoena NRMC-F 0135]MDL5054490.1 phytanoyl-CoA dioxygenase family protein [Oscillatoria laete-virens NRMC-F 0139]